MHASQLLLPESSMADPVGDGESPSLFPKTAGERLRGAREALGLDLNDVAARTRIPVRHLEAIETSNYAGLPSSTYAIGFAKGYARAVGLSEVEIANSVRGELAQTNFRNTEFTPYEMDDPKRAPPRGLALAGVLIAVLILIGIGLWYGTSLFRDDGSAPVAVATDTAAPAATATTAATAATPIPPPSNAGQVTLAATDAVWVRVYDAGHKTLFEKTMAAGDRYDVPQNADQPMINVGRPDKLQITLNGSALPPLGDGHVAIKDIGISAAALSARGTGAAPAPAAAASTSAAPRPRPSRSPRAATPSEAPPTASVPEAAPAPAATTAP